jgi:hypothetical protein
MEIIAPPQDATELTAFWTWMGSDGICRTKTKPRAEITLKEAEENSVTVNSFYKGKNFPLLIDTRDIKYIERKAREHFSIGNRDTHVTAFALLVKSPLSRMIGNFFMGLNKPSVPARLFDKETEAIEWLKQFL